MKIIVQLNKLIVLVAVTVLSSLAAEAATLSVSPNTGVYTAGSTFTVKVIVNSSGSAINAADGTLSFNPKELQVISVSRASSIFNLWTTEPTFSNSGGTVTFSGGSPTGYSGSSGNVMNVTFKALGAGTPKVSLSSGSVLAADGRGTNVLTSMGSAAYTISAVSSTPTPEEIVEYVPPANTPAAPKITSDTHPDPSGWSREKTARLSWTLPGDAVAVRTLLDETASAIPTKVYDSPIKDINIADLPEGISYFHIQIKNAEGWGKVAHYRLAVDSEAPKGLLVTLAPDSQLSNPQQVLLATTTQDAGSPIKLFKVGINGADPIEYTNDKLDGKILLSDLRPGRQNIVIEAIDFSGNSATTNFTFEIEAFDAPRFTDVPATVNSGVIPVLFGVTRPRSSVEVRLTTTGAEPLTFTVVSDETGAFRFIPNGKLADGTYQVSAVATDEFGARSVESEPVSFVVQKMGLLRVGSLLISILSVIIPLVALLLLLALSFLYFLSRFKRFKAIIKRESAEVVDSLHLQFSRIRTVLNEHEQTLVDSRKTKKLTAAESSLLDDLHAILDEAEGKVNKEASDVTKLVGK